MAKQTTYFLACILAVLSMNLAAAADEPPVSSETGNSEASPEAAGEVVLNQPATSAERESGETEEPSEAPGEDGPVRDDDFIPSSQISEDLSVSFPVDI